MRGRRGLGRRCGRTLAAAWSLATWRWLVAAGVLLVIFPRTVPNATGDRSVFLAVAERLLQGDRLYADVWDNKDPLFFWSLSLERLVWPEQWDVLGEIAWIGLACLGVWHWSRALGSDQLPAWWAACVAAPLIITGDSYIAGMTSLPGTALGILALGLAARERWTAAGTVGALLCFTKMVVAPIALVGALLVIQGRWRKARGFFSAAVLVGLTILAALAATGSLGPWITIQGKNSAYANGMISHGFLPGVAAQLAADGAPAWVIHLTLALTATTMTIITTTGLLAIWARHRNPLGSRVLLWMTVATVLVASLTTIWPHHRQIFYLPALVALGVATALVPAGNRRILAATMAAATVLSGFNPQLLVHDRYEFRGRLAVAASQPAEGRALASLGPTGTFARVGGPRRADFRGAEGWHLACPQFHHYPFTPPADLDATVACLPSADVIIVASNIAISPRNNPVWNKFSTDVGALLSRDYTCSPLIVEGENVERLCVRGR